VCASDELLQGSHLGWNDRRIADLVDDAFREHARECCGLAELIAVRGMRVKPTPMAF
jgi:hypothetical protein